MTHNRHSAGTRPRARTDAGFTLLEVLVTLAMVSFVVVSLHTSVGGAFESALSTKINRQLRTLAAYQLGQVTVGTLTPDEEDPFPDGQSGNFDDVGGYSAEYANFTWTVRREEIAICGTNEDEMKKSGFEKSESGQLVRAETDDKLGGKDGKGDDAEEPPGQFKTRVVITIKWQAPTADEDREFSVMTYLPVKDEESKAAAAGAGGDGAGGAAGGDKAGGSAGGAAGGSSDAKAAGAKR